MATNKEVLINEKISAPEVRVITADGEQLGVMPTAKALEIAEERGLDLVLIAANSNPPVCKIIDYGKFKYEQTRREKEARKNQKVVEVKEIRLQGKAGRNMSIGEHDIAFKAKNANKFLQAGNKVKLSIMMKGREVANSQKGIEVVNSFIELLKENGEVEKPTGIEGRFIIAIVAPKKK